MGLSLAHEEWGQGATPLLLLHGFTGNRHAWDHLRPGLEPHVRALAVDLPGHGDSAECQSAVGFEETLAELDALLQRLGLAATAVLGYSQGARLALGLALRAPGRILRLILESGTAGLENERARLVRRRQDQRLAAKIEAGGVESFVQEWEGLPLFEGLRYLPEGLARSLRARRLSCSPRGLGVALRSLGVGVQPNYWPLLPSLRVATLLLCGARDLKFTRIAQAMGRELPMAWVRSFEGSWHAPHLEVPTDYAQEVLSFLTTPWFESPSLSQLESQHEA
jgi:2-succinyl-6-hydroxy-2,4-cyclohexadiene-1-carboxylate synthase